jgi:hypothetical protein
MRVVSYEAQFKHALFTRLASGLGNASVRLRAEIQADIGTQGPPRSSPGEAPHRETGALQDSFFDELDADNLIARVGSDSPYVRALELGYAERNLAPRPHIMSALIRESDDLGRLICK